MRYRLVYFLSFLMPVPLTRRVTLDVDGGGVAVGKLHARVRFVVRRGIATGVSSTVQDGPGEGRRNR